MISCEHAQNLFDAYLNDELPGTMTAELDAHLLECASCQHQLSLMEACGNVIRLDTSEPAVSGDFTDRLMAIIEQDAPGRRALQINRAMKTAAGLLGVAAAIALIVALYPSDRPGPAPTLVAGEQVTPPVGTSTLESLADEHFGFSSVSLFDVLERGASVIELGDVGLSKLTASGRDDPDVLDHLPDGPAGGEPEPMELDVTGTLPDLERTSEDL